MKFCEKNPTRENLQGKPTREILRNLHNMEKLEKSGKLGKIGNIWNNWNNWNNWKNLENFGIFHTTSFLYHFKLKFKAYEVRNCRYNLGVPKFTKILNCHY